MEFSLSHSPGSARITLSGHVDEKGAEKIKETLKSLDFDQLNELIFDFKTVNRIGSAGIGQILLAYKNLAVSGGTMRLENVSSTLQELFKNLKLNTLFSITP